MHYSHWSKYKVYFVVGVAAFIEFLWRQVQCVTVIGVNIKCIFVVGVAASEFFGSQLSALVTEVI